MDPQNTTTAFQPGPVNLGKWLSEGWQMVESDMGFFLLLGFIYAGILALVSTSSVGIGYFIIDGPLRIGFFYILFRKMRGEHVEIGQISKGFEFFMAALLSSIVTTLFVGLGLIFCILPGIILMALYMFTAPFILEQNLDFWQAMEASRKLVNEHLFELVLFVIIQGIILFIGLLLCVIGLFIAIPLCLAATAAAYRDLVGLQKPVTA
jgi:hypothetical protein